MEYNTRMTEIEHIGRTRAYFAVVNSEIYLWNAFEKALKDAGQTLTVGRFIPLMFLADSTMRLQELAEVTHTKESATSRLVERMVKDGLIVKERDGADGRAVQLRITPKGREALREAQRVFELCLKQLFGDLAPAELETLCSLLARLEGSREAACA